MMTTKQSQPLVVKHGEGETIQSLGSAITFLFREIGTVSLMEVTAPRGAAAPPHDHDFDESYYMLSGTLAFTLGGEQLVLDAGSFVHIPGGTVHSFKAVSAEPAQFLTFQSHGDADEFFRACAREVKGPADFGRVPAIGAQYGVRVAPSTCNTPR